MKFIFGMQVNIIFYKLIVLIWLCVARHAQSNQNKKFAYLCNISRKCLGKVDYFRAHKHKTFLQADGITLFCLQINVKDFFNLILLFQACVARHSHITQKTKFAISLQCLKKEVSDEVDFFYMQISIKVSYKLIL